MSDFGTHVRPNPEATSGFEECLIAPIDYCFSESSQADSLHECDVATLVDSKLEAASQTSDLYFNNLTNVCESADCASALHEILMSTKLLTQPPSPRSQPVSASLGLGLGPPPPTPLPCLYTTPEPYMTTLCHDCFFEQSADLTSECSSELSVHDLANLVDWQP